MPQYYPSARKISIPMMMLLILAGFMANGQNVNRVQPTWWFGESVAANFNYYRGTTQMLNDNLTVPTAFHKGYGVRPYASLLMEYRPNRFWGGMLNLAYDNRGGKFDGVMAPCNCPANLSTNISYINIEPSLRLAPFGNAFYIFAGPTIDFNITKSFTYTQLHQSDTRADWSNIRSTVLSGQAGAGVDIPVSNPRSATQMEISPFVSFQTDFGHAPRSVESWDMYTIRAGIALKFGTGKRSAPETVQAEPVPVPIPEKDVDFSVRAPKVVPLNRLVKETFPLINSVFFDQGSTEIPNRYVQLSPSQADSFQVSQLQQGQPNNLNYGRSSRELAVYYNILNILGDRLRNHPQSTISLIGSSVNNPAEGKVMAENIKQYLVNNFGIDSSRIQTEGSSMPSIPSQEPGATKDLTLLHQEDRRVDIVSNSPEMLMQVGGATAPYLKPVEISTVEQNPLDSYVLFNADGAQAALQSWTVDVTDEQGNVQHYGPYTQDQASVPGKTILGNNTQGNYKVEMIGITKDGGTIKKESSVSLMKANEAHQEGLRYSILFNFDKSQTIASYAKFLTDVVTPLIPDNGTVIIHGHTDIIGSKKYNLTLSQNRAMGAQKIIEQALSDSGKTGVKFETLGFGSDESTAPFGNTLPEERFYNRTVIFDIIPPTQ
ncbi:MAG: OmpA family protein [Chitinophagaceae bacterium]